MSEKDNVFKGGFHLQGSFDGAGEILLFQLNMYSQSHLPSPTLHFLSFDKGHVFVFKHHLLFHKFRMKHSFSSTLGCFYSLLFTGGKRIFLSCSLWVEKVSTQSFPAITGLNLIGQNWRCLLGCVH